MIVFFPSLSVSHADVLTVVTFMLLGSFSFVGIAMLAAILPLLYVERGAQMTFVIQSVLLLVSGVYYSISVLPGWMQVVSHVSPVDVCARWRPEGPHRRRPGRRPARRRLAADRDGHPVHPDRHLGLRASRAVREAHRQAQASRLMAETMTTGGAVTLRLERESRSSGRCGRPAVPLPRC